MSDSIPSFLVSLRAVGIGGLRLARIAQLGVLGSLSRCGIAYRRLLHRMRLAQG